MLRNKKKLKGWAIAALAAIMVIVFVSMAFAGAANLINTQTTVRGSQQTTLISAATGTTSAYTTNYATFDYPMNNLACDFVSGPSSTTSNVTFKLQANQGSSTTVFDDAVNYGQTAFTMASQATSTMATKSIFVNKPFRTIVATVTSPTTTQTITINCSATQ